MSTQLQKLLSALSLVNNSEKTELDFLNLREEILECIKLEKRRIGTRNWEQKPENKEKRREYFRNYKKDKKIRCECGREVLKHNLSNHKKTNIHNKYLDGLIEEK